MTFQEFYGNIHDFSDEAVVKKWNKIINNLQNIQDPDEIRDIIQDYLGESLSWLESNDVFGTEGMQL